MFDVNRPAKPCLEVGFPVSSLKDQLKHDEWLTLQKIDGTRSHTKLLVTCQYLWSEEKYFTDLVSQWDKDILAQENQIKKNQASLEQINVPNDFIKTVAHGDFYIQRLRPADALPQTEQFQTEKFTGNYMAAIHPLVTLAKVLAFILLILGCLHMVYRSPFDTVGSDLTQIFLACAVIGWIYLQLDYTQEAALFLIVSLFISFILDIAWLCIYTKVSLG